jgi:hypothetical protein
MTFRRILFLCIPLLLVHVPMLAQFKTHVRISWPETGWDTFTASMGVPSFVHRQANYQHADSIPSLMLEFRQYQIEDYRILSPQYHLVSPEEEEWLMSRFTKEYNPSVIYHSSGQPIRWYCGERMR